MRHRKLMLNRQSRTQRGVVLFIALIALVIIMLAAIALVRSVDTGNLIAGNVAFRRAATSSADAGVESAIAWLIAKEQQDQGKDPFSDAGYVLNANDVANGYYTYSANNPTDVNYLNVTAATTWTDQASKSIGSDASGNTIRYIIQRMCKTPNQILSETDCLFSDASVDNNSKIIGIPQPQTGGSSVMYRITARVTGPRNTVSYVQAFAY